MRDTGFSCFFAVVFVNSWCCSCKVNSVNCFVFHHPADPMPSCFLVNQPKWSNCTLAGLCSIQQHCLCVWLSLLLRHSSYMEKHFCLLHAKVTDCAYTKWRKLKWEKGDMFLTTAAPPKHSARFLLFTGNPSINQSFRSMLNLMLRSLASYSNRVSQLSKCYYSVTYSTGATWGLSANQNPILKQRNKRTGLTGNCLIFWLLSFDAKFLGIVENFAHAFFTGEMQKPFMILLLQQEIILDLYLKNSVVRQKRNVFLYQKYTLF